MEQLIHQYEKEREIFSSLACSFENNVTLSSVPSYTVDAHPKKRRALLTRTRDDIWKKKTLPQHFYDLFHCFFYFVN